MQAVASRFLLAHRFREQISNVQPPYPCLLGRRKGNATPSRGGYGWRQGYGNPCTRVCGRCSSIDVTFLPLRVFKRQTYCIPDISSSRKVPECSSRSRQKKPAQPEIAKAVCVVANVWRHVKRLHIVGMNDSCHKNVEVLRASGV